MDELTRLEALTSWVTQEAGGAAFRDLKAIKCYEHLRATFEARLRKGLFGTIQDVRHWLQRVARAVVGDLRSGADPEQGAAMLAFVREALRFLAALDRDLLLRCLSGIGHLEEPYRV